MKKLLYLTTSADYLGGGHKYIFDLARYIKSYGFDVTIGSGQNEKILKEMNKIGIQTVIFHHLKCNKNIFSILLYLLEFKKFLDKNDFDVVHFNDTNSSWGAFVVKLFKFRSKTKTIFTVHGWFPLIKTKKFNSLNFKIYLFILKLFYRILFIPMDKIICVSDYIKRIGIQNHFISNKNSITIYNFVKFNQGYFLERNEAIKQIGHYNIGIIARLDYTKNIDLLIRATAILKRKGVSLSLIIFGFGPLEKDLNKLIKKLRLENNIVINKNYPMDASRFLKCLDIFVLTSRNESFGFVLLEAMAAGLPIIAINDGAIPEIIENNYNGLLISKRDPIELSEAIIKLFDNKALQKRFSIKGYKILKEKFSEEKTIGKYLNLIKI